MVFYRKYRPQTIAELDNELLRSSLASLLSSSPIPHAFLFTGPKGLGKTSTARIIAKVINCTDKKDPLVSCNKCSQCISIMQGTNIDVLEIDGASHRGIDEIRALQETVHLSPSVAQKKIYIFDEVHMLTVEAFNALLKTLEEPPSHVIFIFCTTEVNKIPATIVSRCFAVRLLPATADQIKRSLKRMIEQEQIAIDEDALPLLITLSDRGFRDAAKILEEMVLFANGKPITKALIEEKYPYVSVAEPVERCLGLLEQHDTQNLLLLLNDLAKKGIESKYLIMQLITVMHERLLIQVQKKEQHNYWSLEMIILFLQGLEGVSNETKHAVIASLPLELFLIQWMQLYPKEQVSSGKPSVYTLKKKEQELKIKQLLGKEEVSEKPLENNTSGTQQEMKGKHDEQSLLMENIIYKIKPLNHALAGLLRGCSITEVTQEKIVMQAAYKFHQERLQDKANEDMVKQMIKEITGKNLSLVILLKGGDKHV